MTQYRLMTYNVRGGTRDPSAVAGRVREVIQSTAPDILAMQEVAEFQDGDGVWRGGVREITPGAESGHRSRWSPDDKVLHAGNRFSLPEVQ